MSLSDLANLGEFLSSIAVLASLIYLAMQVAQNTKHTRAMIQQGRVAGIVSQYLTMADADLVAAHIIGNGGTVTPEEIKRRQFFLECTAMQVRIDDTFTQHQAGLVNDEQFDRSCAHTIGLFREAGVRKFFLDVVLRQATPGRPSKYQAFIKDLIARADASTPAPV